MSKYVGIGMKYKINVEFLSCIAQAHLISFKCLFFLSVFSACVLFSHSNKIYYNAIKFSIHSILELGFGIYEATTTTMNSKYNHCRYNMKTISHSHFPKNFFFFRKIKGKVVSFVLWKFQHSFE